MKPSYKELEEQIGKLQNQLAVSENRALALQGCLDRSRAECEKLGNEANEMRRRVLRVDAARDSGERLSITLDVGQFFFLPARDRERYVRVAVVDAMRNILHSAIPDRELVAMLHD